MRKIVLKYGHPALRLKAEAVQSIDAAVRSLADNMLKTMASEEGLGLAALQIGVNRSVCVVDIPAGLDVDETGDRLHPDVVMPLVMINPQITRQGKRRESQPEGCLSFPGITAPVVRWYRIRAVYTDLDNKRHEIEARGLLARAIQHEIDHLNGILLVDRMSTVRKVSLAGALKRLQASASPNNR